MLDSSEEERSLLFLSKIFFTSSSIYHPGKIEYAADGSRTRLTPLLPRPLESNSFHTFNHYLLITRYYVYLARNKFETPELEVFIVLLEFKIQCEREIVSKDGKELKDIKGLIRT